MSNTVRTPNAAVRLLVTDLRRAASCLTDGVLIGDRLLGEDRVAITFGGSTGRAKAHRRRLWISFEMEVEPRRDDEATGMWRTHTLRYGYAVFGDESGSDEWFAYHYHPMSGISHPHLHVNAEAPWVRKGLRRRDLPTGRVSLEDIVQLLIEDFSVRARKDDWREELDRNRRMFARRRNW